MSTRKNNKKRRRSQLSSSNHKGQSPKKKKQKTNKNKAITPWLSPQHCLSWILFNDAHISVDAFFCNFFGKEPFFIQRKNTSYYNKHQLRLKVSDIHQIIKQNELRFGEHMLCKVSLIPFTLFTLFA